MATIVDRRYVKGQSVNTNRQRFLQRYKKTIKSQVDRYVKQTDIRGIKDNFKRINIPRDDLNEPSYSFDRKKGKNTHVTTGNKQYHKNDKLRKPSRSSADSGGSGGDYDELTFTLSKEEFLDLFFEDLELPNFIKKSLKKEYKLKMQRAGYTKVGSFSKLNLKKTFEHALMRKIASKASGKKVPYLDDIDLRYNLFTKQPHNVQSAAMFCIMDVSGSMTDTHKYLAKLFYVLLYMFLEKVYKNVTIHFVVYHDNAYQVTEEEFFSVDISGGTQASKSLKKVLAIVEDKYSDGLTNLYFAMASDGDNWTDDTPKFLDLFPQLYPHFQYMMYLDVCIHPLRGGTQLASTYRTLIKKLGSEKIKVKTVSARKDIYPVIKDLFKKQGA